MDEVYNGRKSIRHGGLSEQSKSLEAYFSIVQSPCLRKKKLLKKQIQLIRKSCIKEMKRNYTLESNKFRVLRENVSMDEFMNAGIHEKSKFLKLLTHKCMHINLLQPWCNRELNPKYQLKDRIL